MFDLYRRTGQPRLDVHRRSTQVYFDYTFQRFAGGRVT